MSRGFSRRMLVAAILGSVAALMVAVAPAFANTSTPTSTHASAVQNGNGTVTVTVSGTWDWPGQACNGRYGTGWAVGWWGVGSSHPLPSNNFQLSNVSLITSPTQGQGGTSPSTGTQTAAGSWQIQSGALNGQYLYVGTDFNGQQIYTTTFCNQFGGNGAPNGTYTATATYPNANDVPSFICVNTYDIHGSYTKGPSTKDYDAVSNGDNSVHAKQFTESANCATVTITVVPAGGSIGSLGLVGLIALGMLVLFGAQAVIRRRRVKTARS